MRVRPFIAVLVALLALSAGSAPAVPRVRACSQTAVRACAASEETHQTPAEIAFDNPIYLCPPAISLMPGLSNGLAMEFQLPPPAGRL
jgi:hypothetical protein